MKKILVLFLASLLCTTTFAQRNVQPQRGGVRSAKPGGLAQKKHSFYLGLKGGVTFSSMTQPVECDLYDGSGIGFSAVVDDHATTRTVLT